MAGEHPTKIKEVLATQGLAKPCPPKLPETPYWLSLCCKLGAWSSGEGDSPSHMQVRFRESPTRPETYAMSK